MACSVRETITRELRNNNFIDDKNNIIGGAGNVFPYIDSVNQFAKDNFGVTEDVLQTKSMTNVAGARVKIRFNNNVVEQIDTNRESETFNSRLTPEEIMAIPQDLFGNEEVDIPLGDNYGEFVKYKTAQYNRVDNEIKSINSKLYFLINISICWFYYLIAKHLK